MSQRGVTLLRGMCESVREKETDYLFWKKETSCLCIIYLHKMGDMRNSKPINRLDADSFSGHASWEGGCPWSWAIPEPYVTPPGVGRWDGSSGECWPLSAPAELLGALLSLRGVWRFAEMPEVTSPRGCRAGGE